MQQNRTNQINQQKSYCGPQNCFQQSSQYISKLEKKQYFERDHLDIKNFHSQQTFLNDLKNDKKQTQIQYEDKVNQKDIQIQNPKQCKPFFIAKKSPHQSLKNLRRYNGGIFIPKKQLKQLKLIGFTKADIDKLSLEVDDQEILNLRIELEIEKYKNKKKLIEQIQHEISNNGSQYEEIKQMKSVSIQSVSESKYILKNNNEKIDKSTDTNDIPYTEIKDAFTSLVDREDFYNKLIETPIFMNLQEYLEESDQKNKKFNKKKFMQDIMKQMIQKLEKLKLKRNKQKQSNQPQKQVYKEYIIPSPTEKQQKETPITQQFIVDKNGKRQFNTNYAEEKIISTEYGKVRQCKNSMQFEGDICDPQLWNDVIQKQKQRNSSWMFTNILMDPAWPLTALNLPYKELENQKWMDSIPIKDLQKVGYLWMWVTNGQLESALKYFEKNNYKRVDIVYWFKVNEDWTPDDLIGYYLRHTVEMCLVGQLQDNMDLLKQLQQTHKAPHYIVAPRREQSRKPDKIYQIIKTLMPYGDCLEIFGRTYNIHDEFWTVGNESIQLKEEANQNPNDKCV